MRKRVYLEKGTTHRKTQHKEKQSWFTLQVCWGEEGGGGVGWGELGLGSEMPAVGSHYISEREWTAAWSEAAADHHQNRVPTHTQPFRIANLRHLTLFHSSRKTHYPPPDIPPFPHSSRKRKIPIFYKSTWTNTPTATTCLPFLAHARKGRPEVHPWSGPPTGNI